jgi:type IV pilus assembly protein PilO
MKLTSMQKMLGVVAAIVVVLIAAVVLLVVPKFSELAQLDVELQAAKDQVDQTKALLAQLDQARSNAALTQAELLALANQMPENPELPSLLIELQDVSNTAGVRFNRVVVPGDPAPIAGAGYIEIPVSVEITGKWADILDYLRRINGMTRAIRVMRVAFPQPTTSASTTETVEPDLTSTLDIKAYVMSPPAPKAPEPPAAQASPTQP